MRKLVLFILIISYSFNSVAQKDTLDYSIRKWSLTEFLSKTRLPLDTFLTNFQTYLPIYHQGFPQVYNGNIGQAYQNTNYLNRQEQPFYFFSPYSSYLFLPENTPFFNTKQQYTRLHYITNFSKKNNLQNLDILHTQNITPYLNMGIQYRLLGANGEYKAQKSKNHFFRAFASYERKKYTAYFVYNYNKINSYLNGGITSDTLLDNPNTNNPDTKTIPVFLENSTNSILGRNINLRQYYTFYQKTVDDSTDTINQKPDRALFRIGHKLNWNYNKRIYNNENGVGFYQEAFIDSSALSGNLAIDSTGYMNLSNSFFITFIDDSVNQTLPEITVAYQNNQEFFHSYHNTQNYIHHTTILKINNPVFSKWYWSLRTEYTFLGGNKDDYRIDGNIQRFFGQKRQHNVQFLASSSESSPNIFSQSYSSNFYKWEKSFDKFSLSVLGLSYRNDKLKFKIGVKQAYLGNYVYFASKQDSIQQNDSLTTFETIAGYPFQERTNFSILTFYLNHQFDWGPFHIKNALVYQQNSNDSVLHIPKISYYNSTFFQMHFFKRVLTAQVGFDLRYNSSYYIDGFMPATGLYYNQYDKKYGYYPYFDFFINLKLKRARIFFKMEHINKGLNGNQYYTSLNHPMNPRVFRFGLSWRFYN